MTRPFERRRAERKLIVCGGTVQQGETSHACLIRDVSANGLFLYSGVVPAVGETIRVSFGDVVFEGLVVRVETKGFGAATGIGIMFTRVGVAGTMDVPKQASTQPPR